MRRRCFLAASAAALALPAVVRAESQRVLKFIPDGNLSILDPVWTTQYATHEHSYMVFDSCMGRADTRTASRLRCRCWPATPSRTTARPGD